MKNDEFQEFLDSPHVTVPNDLSHNVLSKVSSMMQVSGWKVFSILFICHTLSTLIVLYFCPQFGVSWGQASFSLTQVFMKWGHLACAALCGLTWIGLTFFFTAAVLKSHESFWLKAQMPWIPLSLTLMTLIILGLAGAQAHHTEFIFWIIAAAVGGWGTFEFGRKSHLHFKALRIT